MRMHYDWEQAPRLYETTTVIQSTLGMKLAWVIGFHLGAVRAYVLMDSLKRLMPNRWECYFRWGACCGLDRAKHLSEEDK